MRSDSPLQSVADLGGKTVSLGIGSWLQALLATALDGAELTWKDLTEPELRQALLVGDIDAWVSGGGLRGDADKVRAIANTGDLVANPSVFFARRDFAERHPELIDLVAGALDYTDRWIAANAVEAGSVLARAAGGPLSAAEWQAHITQRPWGLQPVDEAFLSEQQRCRAPLPSLWTDAAADRRAAGDAFGAGQFCKGSLSQPRDKGTVVVQRERRT